MSRTIWTTRLDWMSNVYLSEVVWKVAAHIYEKTREAIREACRMYGRRRLRLDLSGVACMHLKFGSPIERDECCDGRQMRGR